MDDATHAAAADAKMRTFAVLWAAALLFDVAVRGEQRAKAAHDDVHPGQ